jgi:formylglycine-generating enzyme required for sulfatase activity
MRHLLTLFALATISGSLFADEPAPTPTVAIPAGTYTRCIGCAKSAEVVLTLSAYRIDQDEVTLRQYAVCVKTKKCSPPKLKGKSTSLDEPVRGVLWRDAESYCKFVGKRLPTAAEWEHAAFPPTKDNFNGPNGPRIETNEPCKALLIGGYDGKKCPDRSLSGPAEVVLKGIKIGQPAALLLDRVESAPGATIYDAYGDVAEWVSDWDSLPGDPEDYFKPHTRTNPAGPATGKEKLIEGGSYASTSGAMTSELRRAYPDERPTDVGFRCATTTN